MKIRRLILFFSAVFIIVGCSKDGSQASSSGKKAAEEDPGKEEPAVSPVKTETASGTIDGGKTLALSENYIRKGCLLEAEMTFDSFGKIIIARGGTGVFYGAWIEVDATNVASYRYTQKNEQLASEKHGLNISKDLKVVIDFKDASKAKVTLTSDGKSKTVEMKWWGGGKPYIKNCGNSAINATISFTPRDCEYSVWIIGDSYIDWTYDARWPYYLYQKGYRKWMGDHLPGAGSEVMYKSFLVDLNFGVKPDFAIWCMGMNDGADSKTAPVGKWKTNVEKFIATCEENGITPILTTVPPIPSRDHSQKTEWVRNSGKRYIDFTKAVYDTEKKAWKTGYLSSDNIHPASAGAKAMADQVMSDFPEIKNL